MMTGPHDLEDGGKSRGGFLEEVISWLVSSRDQDLSPGKEDANGTSRTKNIVP